MDDLVVATEIAVLVGKRVEAVRTGRDDLAHVVPLSTSTFSFARSWKRYSLPILRAGSPVHFSSVPRMAKSTPAA